MYPLTKAQTTEGTCGTGEMAQQLRSLAALPVDSGSVSNSYMIAHNYNASSRVSNTHSHLGTLYTHGPQRYMKAKHPYT